MQDFDVIIVGAGAAGLMCASVAGQRGLRVLLIDKANKVGKKILMSGGGKCNFTNLDIGYENYLSHNKHFFKSALSRYTQWDFIALVEQYGIKYFEKTLGQLFCHDKAKLIVEMLLSECAKGKVDIRLKQDTSKIEQTVEGGFKLVIDGENFACKSLIIATGGLSIPTMGASPFGYKVAKQFGLKVYPTRAGLVPYTLHTHDKERFAELAGISIESSVACNGVSFKESLLFTHRGVSGPAILQISSYWQPGDTVDICLLPDLDFAEIINAAKLDNNKQQLKTVLIKYAAKKIIKAFFEEDFLAKPLKQITKQDIDFIIKTLQHWQLKPNATEGYRTAEVTIGGVDCDELSSKTFEAKKVKNLYFIGEVIDVTGWLGGYNFQWAWASAQACGGGVVKFI